MARYRSQSSPFPHTTQVTSSISAASSWEYGQSHPIIDIIPTPTTTLTFDQLEIDQADTNDFGFLGNHIAQNSSNVPISGFVPIQPSLHDALSLSVPTQSTLDKFQTMPTLNTGRALIQSSVGMEINVDAKYRRRTQNREAQRKFRERKESYLKNLEEKANRLLQVEDNLKKLEIENEELSLVCIKI
ncbi:hypothetical protein BKA69DRAFT_1079980 [Paraphysoderma sedebokerense]|nr:hypothetical protein BKA69DRAFT_1079980 [Paraphysoderma sedebokerense]